MIEWPEHLVMDIARRRAILFLGSGVSANAVSGNDPTRRPPTWEEFLRKGINLCANPTRHIRTLVSRQDYLTACEIIKCKLDEGWNELVHREFVEPQFQATEIHRDIFQLDSRVVLTQNVDKIYDTLALNESNNTVYLKVYSQEDIGSVVRGDRRCVLKAHGTVDTPSKMIFTREEYATARYRYAGFYSLLDALAVTHTYLFLGCGLTDPDVRMMLERHAQIFPCNRPHYMVASRTAIHEDLRRSVKRNMNLRLLLYRPDNHHQEFKDSVQTLVQKVEERREELTRTRDW